MSRALSCRLCLTCILLHHVFAFDKRSLMHNCACHIRATLNYNCLAAACLTASLRSALQLGRQALSGHSTRGGYRIGVEKRFQGGEAVEGADNACGPGQYAVARISMSRLSTKGPAPPRIAFRTGTRKQRVYLPVRSWCRVLCDACTAAGGSPLRTTGSAARRPAANALVTSTCQHTASFTSACRVAKTLTSRGTAARSTRTLQPRRLALRHAACSPTRLPSVSLSRCALRACRVL